MAGRPAATSEEGRPVKRSRSKVRNALPRRAIKDLRQIERHSVKEWGRKAADKYLDDVTAALDRTSRSPQLLQDASGRQSWHSRVKFLPYSQSRSCVRLPRQLRHCPHSDPHQYGSPCTAA